MEEVLKEYIQIKYSLIMNFQLFLNIILQKIWITLKNIFFKNDCKLQIVYPDITIDLNNYKDPLKSYLNEVFIQLNPTLYIKRNMFFMNQYLMDDDDILFEIFNEVGYSFITSLFSKYEEYSLYLGLNRSITNPPEKIKYAKLYMRADTKKQI